NCVSGATSPCAPYVCGPTSCTATCSNDAACATSYSCDVDLSKCTNGPKCTDYCTTIMANCTSGNQQYSARNSCDAVCAVLPPGMTTDTGGDSVGCRENHAKFAAMAPVTHCPHAGPGGAGVCGANCEGYCTIALAVCPGVYTDMASCLTT